ncbi:MAG: GTP-binding protein [Methylocystaceae bacterium]|nr:GTP-binding protein [Methylocystaceae bacterium]
MTYPIPVTILTGFLGSGKSTILSAVLKSDAFSNAAVIVNEFGDVGLDDFMVVHSEEQIVEMTTGCLCCTIRGDITQSLLDLLEKRKSGAIKPFDHVIIETTGLADPAPVLHTLATHPQFMIQTRINGTLVTLDGINGLHTLDQYDECVKQLALADRIVLTKTDLEIDPAAVHDLKVKVRDINAHAPFVEKAQVLEDLPGLFSFAQLDQDVKRADLEKWLGQDQHEHHHHHDHNHNHDHGKTIHSFSLTFEEPVSQQAFVLSMRMLLGNQGENLLRIKGIIRLAHEPERPYIIHGVQHVFHEPAVLDHWPEGVSDTTLVFITRGITKETIETYFKTWLNPEHVDMLEALE